MANSLSNKHTYIALRRRATKHPAKINGLFWVNPWCSLCHAGSVAAYVAFDGRLSFSASISYNLMSSILNSCFFFFLGMIFITTYAYGMCLARFSDCFSLHVSLSYCHCCSFEAAILSVVELLVLLLSRAWSILFNTMTWRDLIPLQRFPTRWLNLILPVTQRKTKEMSFSAFQCERGGMAVPFLSVYVYTFGDDRGRVKVFFSQVPCLCVSCAVEPFDTPQPRLISGSLQLCITVTV